jgi:hypothetical protein
VATLGSLVVSLEANTAKFSSDLGRAVTMAEASMNQISKVVGRTQQAFAMLAGGIGAYQAVAFVSNVIKGTASLEGLRAETGLSVTALSALENEGARVGFGLDQATQAFDRMQKQAAAAVGGNKTSTAAFAAIGISAQQLAAGLKDPDALLITVAEHLEKYADDGNKTALMMTLFGRAGASFTEVLGKLAAAHYTAATATAEQAKQAHDFEEEIADLGTTLTSWTRNVLTTFIPAVKIIGAGLITGFSNAWVTVKYDFQIALSWMQGKLVDFAQMLPNVMSKLPGVGDAGKNMSASLDALRGPNIGDLQKQKADAMAQNAKIMAEAAADYVRATSGPPVTPAGPAKQSIVPPQTKDLTAGLKGIFDARLKVIQDAIKAEDEAEKALNVQLDQNYANGLSSLAQYSTDKQALLEKSFRDTQVMYQNEIALAVQLYNQQKDAQAKSEALDKVRSLAENMAQAQSAHDVQQTALNKTINEDAAKLAKTITDVSIAYANLNGDTLTATQLQIQQNDGMTKQILLANGLTDAYGKLVAVEQDSVLRSTNTASAGAAVAIADYKKNLENVGKFTQDITTQMFTSMQDAFATFLFQPFNGGLKKMLASWVQTIDQMVAKAAAQAIFKSLFGNTTFLSALGGIFGVNTSSGGSSGVSADYMMNGPSHYATGGSFKVGGTGPTDSKLVKFWASPDETVSVMTPGQAAGAGGSVSFNPTYNVGSGVSRSDVISACAATQKATIAEITKMIRGGRFA